jgi:RNA polymerase sigma-70 factor (ECF subfamily)
VARASSRRKSSSGRAAPRPTTTPSASRTIDDVGNEVLPQRRRLWRLAYRLTGSAADADDVVQDTLVRWIEHSAGGVQPPDAWLVRVATHLGIDALRARRRRAYIGTWLPEPVAGSDDEESLDKCASTDMDPEARYGLAESATLAFLVALEALSPRQRATLLLRDVFGYSASEVAEYAGLSEGNVRVLHLRARRTLASYDLTRCIPTAELRARHQAALEQLLGALGAQDGRALEDLLAETVRAVTDGGGEYTALPAPLIGRSRVARFYLRAALNRAAGGSTWKIRLVNGLPAALITLARPVRRQAPLTMMGVQLAADGRVQALHTVLASAKLLHLR